MPRVGVAEMNGDESAENADQPVKDGDLPKRKLAQEPRQQLALLALSVDYIASNKCKQKEELYLLPVTAARAAFCICQVRFT